MESQLDGHFFCWVVGEKAIQLRVCVSLYVHWHLDVYFHVWPSSVCVVLQMVVQHHGEYILWWSSGVWGCVCTDGHLGAHLRREGPLPPWESISASVELWGASLYFSISPSSTLWSCPEFSLILPLRDLPSQCSMGLNLILQSLSFSHNKNHTVLPLFLIRQDSGSLLSGGCLYWSIPVHRRFSFPNRTFFFSSFRK